MKLLKHFLILLVMPVSPVYAADYEANISFTQRVILSVTVTGEVAEVNVRKGDQFKKGEVLLSLNKIPFEASVRQAKANLKKTQAIQQEADRDHQHLVELYDRGVLSKVELENAELKLQRTTADFNAAQSKLTQAQYDLQHAIIEAPFDGLVLDVRIRPHESVNNVVSVMPLMTVAAKNKYTATTLAPLSAVNKLETGSSVKVSVGKKSYTGTVSGIGFEPVENKGKGQMYEVHVDFDSKGKLLRAGQSASVSF